MPCESSRRVRALGAAILCTILIVAPIAFGQASPPVIEPRDCVLLAGLGAGADRTSSAIAVATMGRASVTVTWASLTGTVDGAAKVQVSSTASPPGSGDWSDKTGAGFVASGADGSETISITNLTERWLRLVWTHHSVSGGTVTANCHAKGI